MSAVQRATLQVPSYIKHPFDTTQSWIRDKFRPNWTMLKNLKDSSIQIRLDPQQPGILLGGYTAGDGMNIESSLDLNSFVGNHNGKFKVPAEQFAKSAENIWLDGVILHARLRQIKGKLKDATLDLSKLIYTGDGRLVPETVYSCDVCRAFPSKIQDPRGHERTESITFPANDLSSDRRATGCPSCALIEATFRTLPSDIFVSSATSVTCIYEGSGGFPELEFRRESHAREILRKRFMLYATADERNASKRFERLPRLKHVSGDSRSDQCISLARSWLENCLSNHKKCKSQSKIASSRQPGFLSRNRSASPSDSRSPLPARILDIGGIDSEIVQAKNSSGQFGQYACLTHAWGKTQSLMLNQGNKQRLEQGIRLQELPKTYSDAIAFCRRLGIRYIWIDALCIIQDGDDDWCVESAKMGSYYSQGLVTIAATNSADHDGGCSVAAKKIEFAGEDRDGTSYCVYVRESAPHIPDDSDYFPLLTRAWVYQERRLSRRVIHFCETEIFFECDEMTACECNRETLPLKGHCWTKARDTHYATHRMLMEIKDKKVRTLHEWHAFVRAYSALSLSFVKDRLPALSGLAALSQASRELYGIPTGRYLAGLWEHHLANDMAWCVGKDLSRWRSEKHSTSLGNGGNNGIVSYASRPRPDEYVAPTWSWASVLDPVLYAPFGHNKTLVNIIEAKTETSSSNEYGAVSGGSIILQGRLLETRWSHSEVIKPTTRDQFLLRDAHGTNMIKIGQDKGMAFFPDYDLLAPGKHNVSTDEMLYVLPLVARTIFGPSREAEFRFRPYSGRPVVETVFLVLKRANGPGMPVFERVGWTEYMGKSAAPEMTNAKEMKIMLV